MSVHTQYGTPQSQINNVIRTRDSHMAAVKVCVVATIGSIFYAVVTMDARPLILSCSATLLSGTSVMGLNHYIAKLQKAAHKD